MLPIIYVHTDGRRIEIYPDRKVRFGYGRVLRSSDSWPVLWRHVVPSLTDAEWFAVPDETGWTRVQP